MYLILLVMLPALYLKLGSYLAFKKKCVNYDVSFHDPEVRILFENFRSSFLQSKQVFFTYFFTNISKSVSLSNKMFQFNKYGIFYELPH